LSGFSGSGWWVFTNAKEMTSRQRTIKVVPYDPSWKVLFEEESSRIKEVVTEGLVEETRFPDSDSSNN